MIFYFLPVCFFCSGFELFLCHFMHVVFYFEGSFLMYPAQLCTSCFFPTFLIALLWHLVLFTFPPIVITRLPPNMLQLGSPAPPPLLGVWKGLSFLSDSFSVLMRAFCVCFWILSLPSLSVQSLNIASANFLKTSVLLCESETVCNQVLSCLSSGLFGISVTWNLWWWSKKLCRNDKNSQPKKSPANKWMQKLVTGNFNPW